MDRLSEWLGLVARPAALRTGASEPITIRSGEIPQATDQAEEILLQHSERLGIFQRSGEIVRVIELPTLRESRGLKRPAGSVMLDPVRAAAMMEAFERVARFQRFSAETKAPAPVDCPARLAATYLARRGSWRLPLLTGIIAAPLMQHDGTIVCKPGYDQATGLFLATTIEWPEVPEKPSQDDASCALIALVKPFSEFPFRSPADTSVHIAAILTAIQRRILDACPLVGYSAPVQRSGKSLLAESAAIISTGQPAPAATVSKDKEEFRKFITASLREGHAVVNLDNVDHPLASPDLAKAITQPEFMDRLLGENTVLRLPTNIFWTATGNNLTFRGDLSSRSLLCRIDAETEHPEERTFAIPDLKAYLMRHRPTLVCAALTALRAFHIAGRPSQKLPRWGGFDDWSTLIREAIVWAGLPDPCETRQTVVAEDPDIDAAADILIQLQESFGEQPFTLKQVVDRANEKGFDDLRRALVAVVPRNDIDVRTLGWWARRWKDRIIQGLRLQRISVESVHPAKWKLGKV